MVAISSSLPQLTRCIAEGKVTITEVVQFFDSRIRILNPQYKAFITVRGRTETDSDAMEAEKYRKAGEAKLCQGIPVAVKDMIDVADTVTTGGTKALARLPDRDATIVKLLKDAGFIMMGKTNMHELAHGITGENPHYGTVPNPHNPERISGGSSSGSAAAVASGMVPVAVGSDTAGSIRIPASYCGIYGFKFGQGVLGMEGCMPLSPTLDQLGFLAVSAGSLKMIFQETTHIACSPPNARVKIGMPVSFFRNHVAEETIRKFNLFCNYLKRHCQAELEETDLPALDSSGKAGRTIVFREAGENYSSLLGDDSLLGRDVAACLALGREISWDEYSEALGFREKLIAELDTVFRHYDFLLMPAVPDSAPDIGTKKIAIQGRQVRLAESLTALNYPASLAGLPVLSIPYFSGNELPIGFQLIAGRHQEAKLLGFGCFFDDIPC